MKPEDFEKQLQRQPLRRVPEGWRGAILEAARQSGTLKEPTRHTTWWRELFWPCPQAWATLAAVWIVILLVNFATPDDRVPVTMAKALPADPQVLTAGGSQQKLLAEIMDEAPVAEPPKPILPRSRSERQANTATV